MLNHHFQGLRSRVVHPGDLSGAELAVWAKFCALRDDLQTPFLTPEFTLATGSVRGGVRVCVIERNASPAAFLPFQFATRLHRLLGVAEPVANPMNDYFGLVAGPDLRLSGNLLLRLAGLNYLGFTHLDEAQLGHGLEAEKPEPGLQILLGDGPAEYWKGLVQRDRKFVEDTLRRERKLEREVGRLRFRIEEPEPEAGLANLLSRKRQQYSRTGAKDVFNAPWRHSLLQRLVRTNAPECAGVLSSLFAGETWVASHFGLRRHGTLHYWFPVYNRDLHRFAPGRLLLKHIIDASADAHIDKIDRGSGDSPAKREFANARHTYYRGAWFNPGIRSTLYRLNCSLRWRLEGN